MKSRKAELRSIILDIISGREKTKYEILELSGLQGGAAEIINRRTGKPAEEFPAYPHDPKLEEEDNMLVQEIFWDLILEKIITPGYNRPNWKLPYFRLHSEVDSKKLK